MDGERLRKGVKDCLEVVSLTVLWHIWNFRNEVLFNTIKPRKSMIWDFIQAYSYWWLSARNNKFKVLWVNWLCNPRFNVVL